jgi:hypothetical protein
MYTGTMIDELMETVERATSQLLESAAEPELEVWAMTLPQLQGSLAGAA